MDAETIAHALNGKRYGNGYRSPCPVCCGSDKSTKFTMTDAGARVLIHCFAGCSFGTLVTELRSRGLWPNATPDQRQQSRVRRGRVAVESARTWLLIAESAMERGEALSAQDRQKLAIVRRIAEDHHEPD